MRKVERHIDKDLLLELQLEQLWPGGLQAGGHVLLLVAHPLLQQVLRRRAHLCVEQFIKERLSRDAYFERFRIRDILIRIRAAHSSKTWSKLKRDLFTRCLFHCSGYVIFWYGTDLDPRIRTTDLRIRILLFSSVTFKMPNFFFFPKFYCLLLFEGKFSSFFNDKKS